MLEVKHKLSRTPGVAIWPEVTSFLWALSLCLVTEYVLYTLIRFHYGPISALIVCSLSGVVFGYHSLKSVGNPASGTTYQILWIQYLVILVSWHSEISVFAPITDYWLLDATLMICGLWLGYQLLELPFQLLANLQRKGSAFKLGDFVLALLAKQFTTLLVDVIVLGTILFIAREQMYCWWVLATMAFFAGGFVYLCIQVEVLQFIGENIKHIDELPQNLAKLVEKSGLKSVHFFQYDRSHSCGYSGGFCSSFAGTYSIGLREDFVNDRPTDEVDYVFAHELGHAVFQDMLRHLVLNAVSIGLGLLVYSLMVVPIGKSGWLFLSDSTNFPALLLAVHLSIYSLTWLARLQSRSHERRADLYALNLCGDSKGMLSRIGNRCSTVSPTARAKVVDRFKCFLSRLGSTHPPDHKRLAMALKWKSQSRQERSPA